MSELPQGWCKASLFDICRPKQWKTISTKDMLSEGFPVYGANGRIGFYHSYNHEKPTILVTCRGATCGVLNLTEGQVWVNGNAMALDDLDDAIAAMKYVYHALQNRGFADVITGSAQPQITRESLRVVELPLAPLAEQRRILAKLEKLLGQVDACQQRLEKMPTLLKRFRQSILAAACSGRLTADWREENPQESVSLPIRTARRPLPAIAADEPLFEAPQSWKWCRLGLLAEFINGDRGKNYPNKSEYVSTGIPFINAGHLLADGTLCSESMHFLTREKFNSLRSGKIQTGDLLYCLRGTLGKTAIVDCIAEGAVASSLVIIRPNEAVERKFLYYFLTSPSGKELVDRFDNGSAQPNLSADSVKNYVIALPPFPEQQEIVRRVAGLFALADQLEQRLAQARRQVDKLTPSLLARAFAGQLVPQNPADEPAEKLLERIQQPAM